MKRVKSACIYQTLVFAQRPELAYSSKQALDINRAEFEQYVASLEKTNTRYRIVEKTELDDGSVEVRIRKQYNDKVDVTEYF